MGDHPRAATGVGTSVGASSDVRKSYCLVSAVFKLGVKRLSERELYTIGRHRRSRIHLPSDTVSRQHAAIVWIEEGGADGGCFVVEDKGSRNGIRVNGDKVTRHVLQDDDLVTISTFRLRFRVMTGDVGVLLDGEGEDFEGGETRELTVDAVAPDSTLAGRFSGTELLEICQLIDHNQRSGRLEVDGGELEGVIEFRDGALVEASAGETTGLDAARALLGQSGGHFEFRTTQGGGEGQGTSVAGLLLELMRQRDENANDSSVGEPPFDPTGDTQGDSGAGDPAFDPAGDTQGDF